MKKYLILAAIGALAATSCKQSEIQQKTELPQGEPIEVALNLSLDQSQAVGRAQAETTSWEGGGFEAQITAEPIDVPQSKAVDDSKVANVWVLQFNGTATTSTLIYRLYIPAYSAGSTVQLLKATTANRVAIVANTFDAAWANGFTIGTATWATVSAATKAVTAQSDVLRSSGGTDYLPMSGSNTGTLAVGGTMNIPLTRTVVQVVVNLRSGADLKATEMSVQLCNVPNATSWFPDTGTGVWPASVTPINYASQQVTGITTTGVKTLTFWVPVNRRGTVAGTTGIVRATNAPAGATYLGVGVGVWRYKVHLGGDFATDYNLKANTKYTYSLTFQTDPAGTDSRAQLIYIEAGGLRWATGNLVATGPHSCAIGAPTDYGVYFQFGSLVGWHGGATGDGTGKATNSLPITVQVNPAGYTGSTSWPAGHYADGTTDDKGYNLPTRDAPTTGIGDPCRYYLGAPWRTPTAAEWLTLIGADGANTNKGMPLKVNNSYLSFPSASYRSNNNGSLTGVDTNGFLWSSSHGQSLFFINSGNVYPQNPRDRMCGMPVRCVQPLPTVTHPPTASDYVTIGLLKWTKGNLVANNANECKVGAPTDGGLYFQLGSLIGYKGGAPANGGTGVGMPTYNGTAWGGAAAWSWSNDVMVYPSELVGTPTAWPQATAGTAHQWYFSGQGVKSGAINATDVPNGVGDPCAYYLGGSWRLPTNAEYGALAAAPANQGPWVTTPAPGRWLGVNPGNASSSMFFPALGFRDSSTGSFYHVTTYGYYWSSSVYSATYGYYLYVHESADVVPQGSYYRSTGFPVRCVASS